MRQSPTEDSVAYVLSAYPVLSQTFVRNEIMALRRAGVVVEVVTMGGGDRKTVSLEWSGPYTSMTDVSLTAAARDLLWWLRHDALALVRLMAALVRCRGGARDLALKGVPTAARALATAGVSRVHTHFGWRATAPALYVAAMLRIPTTATLHAADLYMPSRHLGQRLQQMEKVVTVCEFNVPPIERLGVARAAVAIVPCGVDTEVPHHPVTEPGLVVSVGRLVDKKGFDVLIRAFRTVVDRHPSARLEIVGDGPLRDDLTGLVVELGLTEHVELAGGMPHAEVLARIEAGSVFALSCRQLPNGDSDAMPVAIREAMVRARPVVATAVAGIPESVDEHVGWLVPSGDPEAVAAALVEALDHPDVAAARGARGRERAQRDWSLDGCASQLRQVWSGRA